MNPHMLEDVLMLLVTMGGLCLVFVVGTGVQMLGEWVVRKLRKPPRGATPRRR